MTFFTSISNNNRATFSSFPRQVLRFLIGLLGFKFQCDGMLVNDIRRREEDKTRADAAISLVILKAVYKVLLKEKKEKTFVRNVDFGNPE